jgi:hypothetical protein
VEVVQPGQAVLAVAAAEVVQVLAQMETMVLV